MQPAAGGSDCGLGAFPAAGTDVVTHLWTCLARACRERELPWRTPVLATSGPDGGARARTVVLRGAYEGLRRLELHSDLRAGKVREIAAEPRVSLCFWDAGAALQLRAEGVAVLASPAAAAAAWARVPEAARDLYRSIGAPGSRLADGEALRHGDSTHFAMITVEVCRLEWLWLGPTGHVRGEAVWSGSGWESCALVP